MFNRVGKLGDHKKNALLGLGLLALCWLSYGFTIGKMAISSMIGTLSGPIVFLEQRGLQNFLVVTDLYSALSIEFLFLFIRILSLAGNCLPFLPSGFQQSPFGHY